MLLSDKEYIDPPKRTPDLKNRKIKEECIINSDCASSCCLKLFNSEGEFVHYKN